MAVGETADTRRWARIEKTVEKVSLCVADRCKTSLEVRRVAFLVVGPLSEGIENLNIQLSKIGNISGRKRQVVA